MRTESDLRRLFDDTAATITEDDLGVQSTPTQDLPDTGARRRRTGGTVFAAFAIAVAMAVITVAVVVARDNGPVVTGEPSGPVWVSALNVPPGWTLETRRLLRGGTETVAMRSVATDQICDASTGPGVDPPEKLRRSRAVQVRGEAGRIGRGAADTSSGQPGRWMIQWNPEPRRWAQVACDGDSSKAVGGQQVADSLVFGPTHAALPVSLAGLPDGLAANEITIQHDLYPADKAARVMMPLITDLGPSMHPSLNPEDAERDGTKTVFAVVETLADFKETDSSRKFQQLPDIANRPAQVHTTAEGPGGSVTVRDLTVIDGDYVLLLNTSDYSTDELVQIAEAMQPAHPLDDETTWYPALSALGTR